MRRNRRVYLLSVLCSAYAAFPCATRADVPAIGVTAPLSGTGSAWGEGVRTGLAVAESGCNASGTVKFVLEDDQLQPKNTVAAVNKFIAQGVRGLIVFGSPTSLSVNDIAERHKLPMVGMTIVPRAVEGKRYVMRHWVSAAAENDRVVAEVKSRGYKRIAVVATINDATLELKRLFGASMPSNVVLAEEIERENVDFGALLTKIKQSSPDAIYNLLFTPQPGLFARKVREAGFKGAMFGVHNLDDPAEIAQAQGALEGVWLVTGDDSRGREFNSIYEQRFGKKPPLGAANTHDIACMFVDAVKSGRDVNDFLHAIRGFKGALGEYSALPSNDFSLPVMLKEIRGAISGPPAA